MVEDFEVVDVAAVPSLKRFAGCVEPRRVLQVPDLLVDFLDGVTNLHESVDRTGYLPANIEEAALVIDADDTLVEHSCVLETHATGHLLALPDFTWVLTLTDGSWKSVSLGVSMSSFLT